MLRALAMIALAACTSTHDTPTGKIVSTSLVIDGASFVVAIDATLTGPYPDGEPVWTSQYSDVIYDGVIIDTLSLSAGDQVWHDGAVIHFVDTRTTPPAPLVDRCGKTLPLTVALGVGSDGVPSTSATSDVTIDCR